MSINILNVVNQILSYGDGFVTDAPHLRSYDHTRRLYSIEVSNPKGDARTIPAGGSYTLYNGVVPTSLSGASVISVALLSSSTSIYRLSVTAGPSSFRTARAVSGIVACTVAINNNALAVFSFAAATLTAVQVGDTMRIKGPSMNDAGPYAFNQLNAGIWSVAAVSGTQVSCIRAPNEPFSGTNESVAVAAADVQFYSPDGVQKGNKISISDTLSVVSQKTFEVSDATPTTLDFISTQPIPNESGLTVVPGSIVVYSESKRLVYIEADQEAVVRFDGDLSNYNKISPISPGDPSLIGYLNKFGASYSCVVINKSVNPLNIRYFSAE